MLYLLDLVSTICFAFIGAQAARRVDASWLGVCLSAIMIATGGGTIREILLRNDSIFWLQDIFYFAMVAIGIVSALLIDTAGTQRKSVVEITDCLATSVFVLVGISAAIQAQCHWLFVPCMGVLTGLGGGIVREVIFDGKSKILKNENLTRVVSVVSIAGTIGLFYGFHPMIVLAVVSVVHLIYRTGFQNNTKFQSDIFFKNVQQGSRDNTDSDTADKKSLYKLRRKQFSKNNRFSACHPRTRVPAS